MRKAFFVVTILLTASATLQLYFAAVGVFTSEEENPFALHATNGRIVLPILTLLTIAFAALARAGSRTIWLSALVFLLLVFQTLFILIPVLIFGLESPTGGEVPAVATAIMALHGLNGLAIIALSATLMNRARRLTKTGDAARKTVADQVEVNTVPRS